MKPTRTIKRGFFASLLLGMALLAAGPCWAVVYDLRAEAGSVTMPNGATLNVWGFALGTDQVTVPGPLLRIPDGDDTLTINLTNNLPVPVSLIISGQGLTDAPVFVADAQGRQRVRSFTKETEPGGFQAYTWTGLKPGTFIYQSGTDMDLQVPMGLYGAMTKDAAFGIAYPGVAYDNEVLLFFSELDTQQHMDESAARPLNYRPDYFLINGQPFPAAQAIVDHPIVPNERVLIRLLNTGLKPHVPTLNGEYVQLLAEDGHPYPYPREQYSTLLPPGKTVDALWTPTESGIFALFDRSHHLTTAGAGNGGMQVQLAVIAQAGGPTVVDDGYATLEDTALNVAAPGVLENDTDGLAALLVSDVGSGSLTLNEDGSFDYVPLSDFSGTDSFTYQASDGTLLSLPATVTITVTQENDPPTASVDSYAVDAGSSSNALDVLANDFDVDGDSLTITTVDTTGLAGSVINLGTHVEYTPAAGFTGTEAFTYTAQDPAGLSATAIVTVTVNAVSNQAPTAVDDYATTQQNVPVTIDLVANDEDPDGGIDPTTVTIVSGPTTRGSTVDNLANGTVIYTPRKNFRGTDVFTYNVRDNDGALSNTATVRVNVVR